VEGKAKIFRELPDGHRHTLYIYSDGDLVGYRQVISGEKFPMSAELLEDSMVGFLPAEGFRRLAAESPHFNRNLLLALAREFSVWMNRLTEFAQLPVRARLALALLILHESYRRPGEPVTAITITRTEVAEYIGASLEAVVRALADFRREGLVHARGRRIVLPHPTALLGVLPAV
jgi:CRP-like cAMP-binding protein